MQVGQKWSRPMRGENQMRGVTLVCFLTFALNGWAQNTPPAIAVKRQASPQAAPDGAALQKRIESDLRAPQQDPLANPNIPVRLPAPISSSTERAPADFHPKTDASLT